MSTRVVTGLRIAERFAWGLGIVLLVSYATVRIHGGMMQRQALQSFDEARLAVQQASTAEIGNVADPEVDLRLWCEGRIKAYKATFERADRTPVAVLRIPEIRLEVAVLDGTDDFTLNRGVGLIAGTSRPGEAGNVGIAGHRDGFFRGLKDIAVGNLIELELLSGRETYAVTEISIVDPDQTEVLQPTAEPSITLVTCYPFYFVGSAPRRYIVRATRKSTELTAIGEGERRSTARSSVP
jgi:sortase A